MFGHWLKQTIHGGLAALAILAWAPALSAQTANTGPIVVSDPWARASAGATAVAYITIANGGLAADRLIGAASPASRAVEIHNSTVEGGVMRMNRVEAIEIKPGEKAVLQPSGLHLMLTGLAAPLKEGDSLPLTLTFEKAGEIELRVAIGKAGAMGPAPTPAK